MLPYKILIGYRTLFISSCGFITKRNFLKKLNKQNLYNLCMIASQNKFKIELFYKSNNINNTKRFLTFFLKKKKIRYSIENAYIFKINSFNSTFSNKKSSKNFDDLSDWLFTDKDIPSVYDGYKKFSTPLLTVKNIYNTVEIELKYKCLNISTFQNDNKWFCTFEVKWPKYEKFISKSFSKKKASSSSALKCLFWLDLNKRLKNKSPVIYDKFEMQSVTESIEELSIENSVLKEVEDFLNQHECVIQTNMAKSKYNIINNEDLIFNPNLIYGHPISNLKDNPDKRNSYLKENLNKKNQISNFNFPIINYKFQILQELEENRILIIKGDTGCGKSTQVPQFIIEQMIENNLGNDCSIIISEPRKISAISLAERVAYERNESVGNVVGYHVRLNQKLPKQNGAILFCTTGILLKKIYSNPKLVGCSHIIIDEAHERTIEIDLLLILLKQALKENLSLKVIIMSATLNAELFQKYFNCKTIEIPGKIFPVKMYFLDDICKLNLPVFSKKIFKNNENFVNHELIIKLIRWISQNKPPGAILCFLPTWFDISDIYNELIINPVQNQLLIPLHSKLKYFDQKLIFEKCSPEIRKIILSTDIAETGITVPDVIYVIDSVCSKNCYWDIDKSLSFTNIERISLANLKQRKGRAGRVTDGESYHLITKQQYDELKKYPVPEIFRVSLEKLVLDCKRYSNQKAENFLKGLLQPPRLDSIKNAIYNLKILGALDENENLTALGKKLTMLSTDPKLSKAIVYSSFFQCLGKILVIATHLSLDSDIFLKNIGNSSSMREKKICYHPSSDHIAVTNIYEEWKQIYLKNYLLCQKFSKDNFLFNDRMKTLYDAVQQNYFDTAKTGLVNYKKGLLEESNLLENYFTNVDELVTGVLLAGTDQLLQHRNFGFKKGRFTKNNYSLITENKQRALLVGTSVNYKLKKTTLSSLYSTYFRKNQDIASNVASIFESSIISPISVLLFSQGTVFISNHTRSVNKIVLTIHRKKNLKLTCDEKAAKIILRFRNLMWSFVQFYIETSNDNLSKLEDSYKIYYYKNLMMNTLIKLLSTSKLNKKVDSK